MQSPIYSALDSLSSPTIVADGRAGSAGGGGRAGSPALGDPESPLPALPLWQSGQDPFEAALAACGDGDSPRAPSPIPMRFNLGDLTALEQAHEQELEDPADEITLGALRDQIGATVELLELVREETRLTKERQAQIQGRWECKGYLSLKLAQQFPGRFEKPASWDADLENLTARLDLEHRTETQLRNVLKVEEDCIRGGVLPVLQRSHTRQCAVLNSLSETVESLRAECNAVETQKSSAVALAARRNACVASVNNVYQTMRTQERARDELARAQTSLKQSPNSEAQQIHDDTTARLVSTKAEIEREKTRLRDLIAANTRLEEEAKQRAKEEAENPVKALNFDKAAQGAAGDHAQKERAPFSNSPAANTQIEENMFC